MSILKNLYNNLFHKYNESKKNLITENDEIRKFNEKLKEISDPNDTLYDYPYWYSFIKGRSKIQNESYANKKEEYENYVFGHCEEYSKRLINVWRMC